MPHGHPPTGVPTLTFAVRRTELDGVLIIETDFHRDQRGFFMESYHQQRYRDHGIDHEFVQDNHSRSQRGVLRGIHYQDMSAPMAKLIRCSSGSILDVAVDLRVGSPTFGKWLSEELSLENSRQLLIPVGFGHALLALSEWADVEYKCTGYYTPSAEGAVAWNDPDLAVEWPIEQPVVSPKDMKAMSFKEYLEKPVFRYRT